MASSSWKDIIGNGLPLDPLPPLRPSLSRTVVHAPARACPLTQSEKKIALRNALRYFPARLHAQLAAEFGRELREYGHIYMYRWLPDFPIRAYPWREYPAKCGQCAALMMMIMNNLDPQVAQYPHELVTYGGNGQVFSNWAQFWIVMHYLSIMEEDQTLVMYSGHPMGLFPSHKDAPRVVITNGMMIPNYSSKALYDKYFAQGVTMYGQMTAGGYAYIGPQGIVHGTTITILNAARKFLSNSDLAGKVFVTSGLGGMSGAQPKAAVIAGCVGVVAEISEAALKKRYEQGYVMEWTGDLEGCIDRMKEAKIRKEALSLGYLGNVVDLWERLVKEYESTGDLLVELGSDQTSCHNPFNGGYYPVQLTFDQSNEMMIKNPAKFKQLVQESLRRQIAAIDRLSSEAGMFFWDYGNAFLLECRRAGAKVDSADEQGDENSIRFKYPSYVQAVMGDIFSLGFGPFRWVCCSGEESDLASTDRLALETLEKLAQTAESEEVKQQYEDNIRWIKQAPLHRLVVGSQARILYSDERGRVSIALSFNEAVKSGRLRGPIVISRDHHDVSGTDSPFRETCNVSDGSAFTADMAIQNFVGDSFRGATWVAIHNGGGVGWGEVMNGGFGMFLDGSEDAARRAGMMLSWDVCNGVARRSWSGNPLAKRAIVQSMNRNPSLNVFLPNYVEDETIIDQALL